MADADPRLVAAATALAMTDLRRSGKTAPAVLKRVLPYYMRAAEVCVSAYLATPAELGGDADPVPDEVREAQAVDVEEWAERMGADV